MRFADRVRQAISPLSCAVFSAGIVVIAVTELSESYVGLSSFSYVIAFLPAAIYLVISAMAMLGVIGKDGAALLCLLLVPVFIVLEFLFLMLGFPMGIDGIG